LFPAAGTSGGTTTFGGAILVATGGAAGSQFGNPGADGTVSGANPVLPVVNPLRGYGAGGRGPNNLYYPGSAVNPYIGGQPAGENGQSGYVLVEWLQPI
jgi:hypothetical protein